MFSNREVALAIWGSALFAFLAFNADVRRAIGGVLGAFLAPKIVVWVGLSLAYTAVTVSALQHVGAWTPALLKDTALWWVAGGVALGSLIISSGEGGVFRRISGDALKVTAVVTLIAGKYTFSLAVEMVLVLAILTASMLAAVASANPEHAIVTRVMNRFLIGVGTAMLLFALYSAIGDLRTLGSMDTVREIALAPVLSVLFLPFAYLVVLTSAYEGAFLCLNRDSTPREVRRYAKSRLLRHLGLNVHRVREFRRTRGIHLFGVATRSEVDEIITAAAR